MAAAVSHGEGALLQPRHTPQGWAVGAEAGAVLWEDDEHVCCLLALSLRLGLFTPGQEGSPTGAEPDSLWEMPSSFSRSRASAATNLNRRTYDLEGET